MSLAVRPAEPGAPPARVRVPSQTLALLALLRLTSTVGALVLLAQPVLGSWLGGGNAALLGAHALTGAVLVPLAWGLLAVTLLAWRRGGFPGSLPLAGAALAVLASLPLEPGHAPSSAHGPVGVGVVVLGVALCLWSWRPGRATRSYRAPR